MPRLPEITSKADLPADKHEIYDAIAGSRGKVSFPFSLLLHSPEVAGRVAHVGTYLRFESILPPVDREIAILTAARAADCAFEWAAHVRLATEAGVRAEVIDVIAQRGALDQLPKGEALIVRFGRELLAEHRVADATFAAARAQYGDQGVTDLIGLLGYYTMIACALNAFQAEPPPGSAPLP